MIVHVLQRMQVEAIYDVANDEGAIPAVRRRISMMKHKEWESMATEKLN